MEDIENKILNYFNDTATYKSKSDKVIRPYRSGALKVLNNKYKLYYTGVTLQYLTYILLKAKYKKHEVAETLYNMIDSDTIKAIYCPDIKKIVFEQRNMGHDYYYQTSKNEVLKYLQTFIK
jgi:hypothetical protein